VNWMNSADLPRRISLCGLQLEPEEID